MIRLEKNEEVYEDLLISKSSEIFDSVYEDYSLSINDIKVKTSVEDITIASIKLAFIDIPLSDNEENVRIILIIKWKIRKPQFLQYL